MKSLWQRTIELLRGYPVLWLPVVVAAFLSYYWRIAGRAVAIWIIEWRGHQISVLVGDYNGGASKFVWLAYCSRPAFQILDALPFPLATP